MMMVMMMMVMVMVMVVVALMMLNSKLSCPLTSGPKLAPWFGIPHAAQVQKEIGK